MMNKKQIVAAQVSLYKAVQEHTAEFITTYIRDKEQPYAERMAVLTSAGIWELINDKVKSEFYKEGSEHTNENKERLSTS